MSLRLMDVDFHSVLLWTKSRTKSSPAERGNERESFGAGVAALRLGGTLSLVGAVGGSKVSFNAYHLLNVTLTGYSSESLDGLSW